MGYNSSGGAVFARPTSSVSLEHCRIEENFTFGHGAAIYCELCDLAVSNCFFEDNISNGSGGAIYQEGGIASILNSLFSGNVTRGPNGRDNRGSGISIWDGAQVEVRGCTFTNNRSTIGTVFSSDDSQASLSNCVLWDNRSFHPLVGTALTATFSDVQGGWPGSGNLDLDPVFFNPGSGDYRLAPVSPCINAGDPAFLSSAGEKDIDNESRVHRHRVDMGADEYYPYDCDESGSDDFIDIIEGVSPDCNSNFVPDLCDLLFGLDVDQIPGFGDLIPDSCQPDCNGNGVLDSVELELGIGFDCDSNGVLDECGGKFPATVRLSELDLVSGVTVLGLSASNYMGQVAGETDLNGDGWNDLIIGAPGASPGGLQSAGECYVLFGPIDPLENQSIDLDALDGQKGFRLQGTGSGDRFGAAVAAVGDVNHDGYQDFAVGAYYANPGGRPEAGITYVIFGGTAWGTYPSVGVASLSASQALRIHGAQSDDWSGDDVDAAGDLNGDGIADLVIGARLASRPNLDYCGEGYVVFGTPQLSLIGVLDLAQLNGQNGFTFRSHQAYAELGREVVGGGDVNADGLDDLLIAARRADVGTLYDAGEVYVIFGSPTVGSSGSMNPASLTGSNGFIIRGQMEDGYLGLFGSPLRDMNGDAVADVLVGEFYASPGGLDSAGASYVILGRPGLGAGGFLNIGTLAYPQGFVITGAIELELAGAPVAFGDINDDGAVDLAIGASGASPDGLLQAGKVYVLFGGETLGVSGQVSLAGIGGASGFVIHGAEFDDQIGFGMARIGDVTGDGVDDLSISGISVDAGPNVNAGAVYIIPGIRNPDCDDSGILDYCEIGDGLMADCNNNHYADFCDVASGHSIDVNQNQIPDECETCVTVPGSGNANGQPTIDLADYMDFASCLGDEVPLFVNCSDMDMSGDCVVDLRDFAIFQRQFLE